MQEIDEGHLLISDYNEISNVEIGKEKEEYLKKLSGQNVQLLVNKLWELPIKRVDEALCAVLPDPKLVLPRARKVPAPKPLTKWQKFAKDKGIVKKKKGVAKKKWDDVLQKYVPTYGFKRADAEKQKDWLVELNQNNDPKEDAFTAAKKSKNEKKAKNEYQRLRNLAKAKNVKLPKVGLPSSAYFKDSKQLKTAVTVARVSTASVGKFQNRLPKEKDEKGIASQVTGLKKKKKAPPANMMEEKKITQNIVNSVLNKS